jgi:hypothetical protein
LSLKNMGQRKSQVVQGYASCLLDKLEEVDLI